MHFSNVQLIKNKVKGSLATQKTSTVKVKVETLLALLTSNKKSELTSQLCEKN